MKLYINILLGLILSVISLGAIAKSEESPIKVKVSVYNKYEKINKALAFVYVEDSLIFYVFSDNKGKFSLKLDRNAKYKISVSKPGHVTTSIVFDTHNMKKDQIKKINFPVRLYNLHDKDINTELVAYTVKWNYIIESFESFDYNMGWKMELEEMTEKKEDLSPKN